MKSITPHDQYNISVSQGAFAAAATVFAVYTGNISMLFSLFFVNADVFQFSIQRP